MKAVNPQGSAKAAVIRACQSAYAHSWDGCWTIYDGDAVNKVIGEGKTAAQAWSAAHAALQEKRHDPAR